MSTSREPYEKPTVTEIRPDGTSRVLGRPTEYIVKGKSTVKWHVTIAAETAESAEEMVLDLVENCFAPDMDSALVTDSQDDVVTDYAPVRAREGQ